MRFFVGEFFGAVLAALISSLAEALGSIRGPRGRPVPAVPEYTARAEIPYSTVHRAIRRPRTVLYVVHYSISALQYIVQCSIFALQYMAQRSIFALQYAACRPDAHSKVGIAPWPMLHYGI
jgi:hypothetical protein